MERQPASGPRPARAPHTEAHQPVESARAGQATARQTEPRSAPRPATAAHPGRPPARRRRRADAHASLVFCGMLSLSAARAHVREGVGPRLEARGQQRCQATSRLCSDVRGKPSWRSACLMLPAPRTVAYASRGGAGVDAWVDRRGWRCARQRRCGQGEREHVHIEGICAVMRRTPRGSTRQSVMGRLIEQNAHLYSVAGRVGGHPRSRNGCKEPCQRT